MVRWGMRLASGQFGIPGHRRFVRERGRVRFVLGVVVGRWRVPGPTTTQALTMNMT